MTALCVASRGKNRAKTGYDTLTRDPVTRWFSSDIARFINLLTYLLTYFHFCHVVGSAKQLSRYLCFVEAEGRGNLDTSGSREVLVEVEFLLELS